MGLESSEMGAIAVLWTQCLGQSSKDRMYSLSPIGLMDEMCSEMCSETKIKGLRFVRSYIFLNILLSNPETSFWDISGIWGGGFFFSTSAVFSSIVAARGAVATGRTAALLLLELVDLLELFLLNAEKKPLLPVIEALSLSASESFDKWCDELTGDLIDTTEASSDSL